MIIIKAKYLFGFFQDSDWFGEALRDFFHEHAKYPTRPGDPWNWDAPSSVEACLDATWDMLGKWQARRAVTVDRVRFNREVPAPIRALTKVLNGLGVDSLWMLAQLKDEDRELAARAIFRAVADTSKIKPTKVLTPMFGSKIVHHYFPSLVPVFDDAKIRKMLMASSVWVDGCGPTFRSWKRVTDRAAHSNPAMIDFQDYFAFCGAQIEDAPPDDLKEAREELGERCLRYAPKGLQSDRNWLVWNLDAKVAEFCACGAI